MASPAFQFGIRLDVVGGRGYHPRPAAAVVAGSPASAGATMETTLHRQLKALYAGPKAKCEVWVDGYRIDAVKRGRLIEIQQSSLAALRSKVRTLLQSHSVLIVKPLFARKLIIRRDPKTHQILSQRTSPQHQTVWDLFLELVHFVDVFPHPRLTLEVLLTEIEEQRCDRPSRRWKGKAYRIIDRQLTEVGVRNVFRSAADLRKLLPGDLPTEFTSNELAAAAGLPSWWAQKVTYCLRKTGAVETVGKRRHSWLYRYAVRRAA
ncbi:MAG: hypothetical protein B7Z55_10930 [Planctomycetales bacterium 12-60-4]|nr:MAG: hypothetical protein B7Z55_10930 [Planctomycetales bacterium 12-60-4]